MDAVQASYVVLCCQSAGDSSESLGHKVRNTQEKYYKHETAKVTLQFFSGTDVHR